VVGLLTALVSFFAVVYKLNAISWYRRRGLRGRETPHKQLAWTQALTVDEVKAVKNHFGVTLNDVLVACLAGALSDYFESHEPTLRLQEMLAAIPVSVRALNDWSLGNKVAITWLWLPSDLSAHASDPVQRLRAVNSRMNTLKRSVEAPVGYGYLSVIGKLPFVTSPWFLRFIRGFMHKPHTLFTNVPGPAVQLEFAGAPISSYVAFAPQPGRCALGMGRSHDLVLDGVLVCGVCFSCVGVCFCGFVSFGCGCLSCFRMCVCVCVCVPVWVCVCLFAARLLFACLLFIDLLVPTLFV
jgi:WS/DGAT C-terminal domain